MFKPTLPMQEEIDNNADKINKYAKAIWECGQNIDFDPMLPNWDSFDDPIKDHYISAASYLFIVNETDLLLGG